jgi:hypothetical protein
MKNNSQYKIQLYLNETEHKMLKRLESERDYRISEWMRNLIREAYLTEFVDNTPPIVLPPDTTIKINEEHL